MDVAQLQTWLGLPPGAWPPSPETLLGTDPAAAQDRALALMEKLRPHQLLQPDLVTEGMNRIAQALMALERPAAPPVLDAEPLAEPPPPPRKKRRAKAVPIPNVTVEPPAVADRRRSYRELVRLRHLEAAWSDLGPIFGVPSHELTTSLDVYQFLDATHVAAKFSPARHNLATLFVHHPTSLGLFRDLQHTQRQALAAAWAEAAAQWTAERMALRLRLRQSKPRPTWQRQARFLYRRFRESRTAMPITLLALSVLAAWLRSR